MEKGKPKSKLHFEKFDGSRLHGRGVFAPTFQEKVLNHPPFSSTPEEVVGVVTNPEFGTSKSRESNVIATGADGKPSVIKGPGGTIVDLVNNKVYRPVSQNPKEKGMVPAGRRSSDKINGVLPDLAGVDAGINFWMERSINAMSDQLMKDDPEAQALITQIGKEKLEMVYRKQSYRNIKQQFAGVREISTRTLQIASEAFGENVDWPSLWEKYRESHPGEDIPELMSIDGMQLFFGEVLPNLATSILYAADSIGETVDRKTQELMLKHRTELAILVLESNRDIAEKREELRAEMEEFRIDADVQIAEVMDENAEVLEKGELAKGRVTGAKVSKYGYMVTAMLRVVPSWPVSFVKGSVEEVQRWFNEAEDKVVPASAMIGVVSGGAIGASIAGLPGLVIGAASGGFGAPVTYISVKEAVNAAKDAYTKWKNPPTESEGFTFPGFGPEEPPKDGGFTFPGFGPEEPPKDGGFTFPGFGPEEPPKDKKHPHDH